MTRGNLRRQGTAGEQLAALFLQQHGVRILERNFRSGRSGEIDLIGSDGGVLVFFEVKLRRGTGGGAPEEAVTERKQQSICRTADYYRCIHAVPQDAPVRFDVIGVTIANRKAHLRWIRDAFPYRIRPGAWGGNRGI